MTIEVVMPKLGWTMAEGTIARWLKAEGEEVEIGMPLLEIETDKTTTEVEAPATGNLGKVLAPEGETVPVGQVIAYILAPGEVPPEKWPMPMLVKKAAAPAPVVTPEVTRASPVAQRIAKDKGIDLARVKGSGERGLITKEDVLGYAAQSAQAGVRPESRAKVSPRARRLAEEKAVDLAEIEGTGREGSITERDVLDFVAGHTPLEEGGAIPTRIQQIATQRLTTSFASAPLEEGVVIPTRIQQITAQRLTTSFTSVPHFYLRVEAKAARLVEMRERLMPAIEYGTGMRLTFTDLLLVLVAKALRQHPLVNASWESGKIKIAKEVNIGLATAVKEGLVVPVIKSADKKSLVEIAKERKDLAEKALQGKLRPEELEGGTFTLTNLGMFGVDEFEAIINPPQSAILAVGQIAERPVVEYGQVVARPTIRLTLSLDHRALDGAEGARFLSDLRALIEKEEQEVS